MYIKSLATIPKEKIGAGNGVSRQILIGPDEAPNFAMRRFIIEPGGEMPNHTDQLFVTDRHDHYLGALYLRDLLTNDPEVLVKNIMRTDVSAMHAHIPDTEVAREFENYDLVF